MMFRMRRRYGGMYSGKAKMPVVAPRGQIHPTVSARLQSKHQRESSLLDYKFHPDRL